MELFSFLHAFLLLVSLSFLRSSLCVGTKACSKPRNRKLEAGDC